ncbi:hypothetical protein COT42_04930 [Candidatus Saganbacteria bacterium CG08_land_8_20_14_0_20_45_16]|uniref:Uncharacterized protein n=1 Tax=Candidatus Saganbacteria bacterium CG08_land_8_20_14_0_20_45_16 TaxID=2014293 RepID=A0A2H0XXQ6_UNCSA|nr:MAG: hypothetical protein COT42_04930 [Candidatus Saganbacteria bacterium CG08_land_8_20_14_0_20_45_16]
MQTSDCSVIVNVPETIDLLDPASRKNLDLVGSEIAQKEHLHYEGYVAFTDEPYSLHQAKTTLFFD